MRLMFSFSYQLGTAGWSTAAVSDGERTVALTASYLSDALGDLTRAVIALLRGAEQATLTWHEEPGVTAWRFERQGDDVDMRITQFDNWSGSRVVRARPVEPTLPDALLPRPSSGRDPRRVMAGPGDNWY